MTVVRDAAPMADVPLSVTAVSARLGVSASTLRTWERRYGLGPGDRRAGAHRRYLPEDVARLSRMVELIRSGVGTSDAAASVLATGADVLMDIRDLPAAAVTPIELARAARDGDVASVRRSVESAVSSTDVLRAWNGLIAPALDLVLADPDGDSPGDGGAALLALVALDVLRDVARAGPRSGLPDAVNVAVLTDLAHALPAHVVGVSLRMAGIPTTILTTEPVLGRGGTRRFEEHRATHDVRIAVVLGAGATCENLLSAIAGDECVDVVLVGVDAPPFLDIRVQRVRTLAACVEETVSLARATAEGSDDEPRGEGHS